MEKQWPFLFCFFKIYYQFIPTTKFRNVELILLQTIIKYLNFSKKVSSIKHLKIKYMYAFSINRLNYIFPFKRRKGKTIY